MVQNTSSVSLSLKRLVADMIVEIDQLGYNRRSRRRYRDTYEYLIEFAKQKRLGDKCSEDLLTRFLREYRLGDDELKPGEGWRRHLLWGVKVLADFAKNGCIERPYVDLKAIRLVPAMRRILLDYQRYCTDRQHIRTATLARRTDRLTVFLDFLHSRKGQTLRSGHEISSRVQAISGIAV